MIALFKALICHYNSSIVPAGHHPRLGEHVVHGGDALTE